MKFLLDQGLSYWAAGVLRARGIDVTHVSEIGMAAAPDVDILRRARDFNEVIVTLDHDFPAALARECADTPSIILLRFERMSGEDLIELMARLDPGAVASLKEGAVATISPAGIRVRRLPLVAEEE